ncbi:MAG: asparagine synthase (glutamine-hydrolyzing) [Flavobacteriales bacterium]|nr:asparagine synthase (glutamine-hydrolyzing) [Flavobacteriales bacterium]
MCGIAGIISPENTEVSNFLNLALKSQHHRGPDAEGVLSDNGIGVCHSRLSIIDLEGGVQPMIYQDWVIVYNGETYNYQSLRNDLKAKGFEFESSSDTEVILKGFICYGKEILAKLRGMFAFCIWNRKSNTFFLARDPFGIKPLHYYSNNNIFSFSSEINPLIENYRQSITMDPDAIDAFLTLQYIPSPYTAYKEIRKLEPGNWMEISSNGTICDQGSYFDILSYQPSSMRLSSYQDAREYLKETLTESVRAHMVSDVEVGTFLSGGIDSTLVTMLAQQLSPHKVHSFSVGFSEADHDESAYALQAAQKIGTNHHTYMVNGISPDQIQTISRAYGEPYGDSSSIPTYFVSKLASEYVKVCLTGDGSDELFFGYQRYFGWLRKTRRYDSIPNWKKFYVKQMRKINAERYGPLPDEPNFSRWLSTVHFMPAEERETLWGTKQSANRILKSMELNFNRLEGSVMEKARRMEILYYLNNDILTKVDIASMLNSLETRPPFTDMRVLDAALNIENSFLYRKKPESDEYIGKAIVKDLLAEHFSEDFIHRPKMGFSMPLDKWLFMGETGDFIRDELLNPNAKILSLFDKSVIESRVNGIIKSPAGKAGPLWNLLMLHLWLEHA